VKESRKGGDLCLYSEYVDLGCVGDGLAEPSAYVFGASEQGQQALRAQEGMSYGW